MSSAAPVLSHPIDPGDVRRALDGIPNIVEARVVGDHVYVIRADHDVARDERIVAALLDVWNLHLVPQGMASTVPDGVRAV